jgi:hypothetical protein
MISREDFREFPTRRIRPEDGLAVTAQVWEAAHTYHRLRLRFHNLLRHEPGILAGLGVIASDPPDSTVYVLPGMAVDPRGETIVVAEPVAYDIGSAQGLLHLLLTYEESQSSVQTGHEDEPVYIDGRFGIVAASALPASGDSADTAYVELARLQRKDRSDPITDARDALHPAPNEIDLRFRLEMSVSVPQIAGLAVSYTGGSTSRSHGHGVDLLARALRQSGRGLRPVLWPGTGSAASSASAATLPPPQAVAVDDDVALAADLSSYALVYLVGQEAFQLSRDEMNALYAYLQAGGTVLVESCRRETAGDAPPADASFSDLLASMGIQLKELAGDHPLLLEPNLFAAPPPGFETEGPPAVLVGGGVIFSTNDYGCLWQGLRRGRPASREEIRSAMDWGANLLAYAIERRKKARQV